MKDLRKTVLCACVRTYIRRCSELEFQVRSCTTCLSCTDDRGTKLLSSLFSLPFHTPSHLCRKDKKWSLEFWLVDNPWSCEKNGAYSIVAQGSGPGSTILSLLDRASTEVLAFLRTECFFPTATAALLVKVSFVLRGRIFRIYSRDL